MEVMEKNKMKLVCIRNCHCRAEGSLGYNKYVAKLSDLVTPALDYSPAPLGDGTHQPTKKVLVSMDFPPHFDNLVLQLSDVLALQ